TEIYVKQVLGITKEYEVHGLVDITGGGLRNILRMKKGLRYVIDSPIPPAPIFSIIQELGEVEEKEMYQTFNMSTGFMMILPEEDAVFIENEYDNANIIGRAEKGDGVYFEPGKILYDHY
ncbi:MAG: phosphoribosylformylglycinamidine cyclo-ligase, partial [Candidatus Methanoplasma sp.]|nr:phosphoribosylformylglycinamidine cyclo-ligase [Candidatus Methanoplasma sp.]